MENEKVVERRLQRFDNELRRLCKKHNIKLYAANVIQENGEVNPVIKSMDLTAMQKMYENRTKERGSANKKAQADSPKK